MSLISVIKEVTLFACKIFNNICITGKSDTLITSKLFIVYKGSILEFMAITFFVFCQVELFSHFYASHPGRYPGNSYYSRRQMVREPPIKI